MSLHFTPAESNQDEQERRLFAGLESADKEGQGRQEIAIKNDGDPIPRAPRSSCEASPRAECK